MVKSQKVQQELKRQKSLSRNEQFHSKTMETRALQEDGIPGKITDIGVENNFQYVGRTKRVSMASNAFCSPSYESRNKIHDLINEIDDNILQQTYTIRYNPTVNIEISLDNSEKGYISFSDKLNHKESDCVKFINKIFNMCGESFSNISEQDIIVVHNPTSNTGGEFIIPDKNNSLKTHRRLYTDEFESTEDYDVIDSWFKYMDNWSHPQGWVETNIKEVYTDGDYISLLVETPTNETLFKIPFSKDSNSQFWNLVENVGHGDPVNIKDESIYVAPFYNVFNFDTFDYITPDIENEWVISTSPPVNEKDKRSRSYLSKLKNRFNL